MWLVLLFLPISLWKLRNYPMNSIGSGFAENGAWLACSCHWLCNCFGFATVTLKLIKYFEIVLRNSSNLTEQKSSWMNETAVYRVTMRTSKLTYATLWSCSHHGSNFLTRSRALDSFTCDYWPSYRKIVNSKHICLWADS